MRAVKWYIADSNFGDMLTPHVLSYFNIPFRYSEIKNADTLCIGSIARFATSGMTVLGSGVIRRNEELNPDAIWRFVRGPHTRANVIACGGSCPKLYGDPALLLPLFCEESEKEYDVGLVPHYWDYDRAHNRFSGDCHVIDVVNPDPLEVAREITKCRHILSSSLHGIICAHAYGIPATHLKFSTLWGDGIKFEDYYASIDLVNLDAIINVFSEMGQ